ncbi:unnamed protein product, partial [Brassica napus]
QVSETVSVHCGVFNENGGFSISDEDNKYMRSCKIVVSACAFGPLVGEITFTNPLDCLRHQLKRFATLRFGMMLHSQRRKQRVIKLARILFG